MAKKFTAIYRKEMANICPELELWYQLRIKNTLQAFRTMLECDAYEQFNRSRRSFCIFNESVSLTRTRQHLMSAILKAANSNKNLTRFPRVKHYSLAF